MNIDWSALGSKVIEWLTTTGIKLVVGLFVLWLSFKIINRVSSRIEKKMAKNPRLDVTVASFLTPFIRKLLKFFMIMCFVGYIGIETSSIVAAITGAGLGVGLALQGALSNLAGGFIILFMRPFKVGDYITTCGESGTVESIQIFYTTLVTPDNTVIMLPNGKVADDSIINVSVKKLRRVDLTFSISYKNDFRRAKELIKKCINRNNLSLNKPEPFINISNYNNNSIEITARTWVKNDDYWDFYFKILEDVKKEFEENEIESPYSKVDVNLIGNK